MLVPLGIPSSGYCRDFLYRHDLLALCQGGTDVHHVVFLVKKRPNMSQEAFARYWIDEHTPLTAKVGGLRSYRCYPAHAGQEGAPFDAVAVLAFDSREAAESAMATPAFAAALADAPNFQDTAATTAFTAEERVIV